MEEKYSRKPKWAYKYYDWMAHHDVIFYIVSFTWGLLASLIGIIIMIPFLFTGKVRVFCNRLYGVFPKCFGSGWGFEMGCFFFTSNDTEHCWSLLRHEMGHGIQNTLFGPFNLFIITIPSIIRFWIYVIKDKKGKKLKPYDSIWFEGSATKIGTYFMTRKDYWDK